MRKNQAGIPTVLWASPSEKFLKLSPMQGAEAKRERYRRLLAVDTLSGHGEIRVSVVGRSMLPTFWPGDILTIRSASIEDCAPGEVVLFESENHLVTHRVVREVGHRLDRYLLTRGDAVYHEDSPICTSRLLGRVIAVERRGRTLPVAPLSTTARVAGLFLGSFPHLGSLALRMHARRLPSLGLYSPLSLRRFI